MAGTTSNREIIDFSDERRCYGALLGRDDLLAELTARCDEAAAGGGWVLVQGGPGLGKSALLSHWLGSLEAPRWSHHFIRRGVEDWDQRAPARPRHPARAPPQALLVTGDVAVRGAASEYADAAAFLRGFGIPDPRIVVVPGNHDVQRNKERGTLRLLRELRSGDLSLDEALDHEEDAELLRASAAPPTSGLRAGGRGPAGLDRAA